MDLVVTGGCGPCDFQIATNSLEDSSIPAADFNVFPEYTECRPEVSNDNIIDTILALATGDGIY
ncbi:hypothetical protein GQ600_21678 [Phytophthora cactorum]|nr:hypothetical protein GQ600_21678 [Phytophthora cactorum]